MSHRAVKTTCLALIVAIALVGTAERILHVNNVQNAVTINGFTMEPENSLDVVIMGASEVYSDFSPGQAWEEQGFTSFCYGTEGAPASLWKPMLTEIRKTQTPKLIVVEVNGAVSDNDSYQTNEGSLRKYLDNTPFSQNRMDAISEIVSEDLRSSFYFPFLKYHSNWQQPAKCAQNILYSYILAKQGGVLSKRSSVERISSGARSTRCNNRCCI